MPSHLLTRGLTTGYAYLGSPPREPWWNRLAHLTCFADPSLLVHADARGWRLYASAIPSLRQDVRGTRIRFDLALAGPADDGASVAALARAWVEDAATGEPWRLTALFDEHFPAGAVDRMLVAPGADQDPVVIARLDRVLAALTTDPAGPGAAVGPDVAPAVRLGAPDGGDAGWAGDRHDSGQRLVFLAHLDALLTGRATGWAGWLNRAGAADIEGALDALREPLAALVDERLPGGHATFRGGWRPKATAPWPRAGHGGMARTVPASPRLVGAALVTTALTVALPLVGRMMTGEWRRSRRPGQ
jgi:hypothetical protein